ncbi:hypothetical protein DIPPA_28647 [Diplonema papillatum]|nr:hypothetical protein DIPPA_02193 [Diplonema papillatum]KAJ9445910.1 hypothetical protein DIPPA_28647 [Diplonema papillatum]
MVKNIVRGIVGRHRGHAHRAMQFAMLPKVTKPNLRGKKKKKILKLDERLLSPATSQGDKSEDEKKGAEESQPASVEASQDLLAMQVVQQKVSAPVSGAENVLALNDSWSFRQQSNISSSTAEVTKQQAEVKAPSGRAFGETLGAANEGQSELAVSPDSASSAESGNSEADDDDADAVSASSACKAAFPTDEAAKSEPVTFQFNLTSLAPADANPAPVGFGFGPAVAEPTLTDFKFFAVPTTPAPVQAAATPAAGQMARAVLSPSLIDPRCVMPRGTPRQGEKGGEAGEEEAAAGDSRLSRLTLDSPRGPPKRRRRFRTTSESSGLCTKARSRRLGPSAGA